MKIRKDEDLARDARIRVESWRGHWKYNIDQYNQFMNFVLGRQWTDDEEDMLKSFKKVPLQFNKLATLVNTLLGEQQQNTPQINVNPLSNAEEEAVSIRQALVRNISLSHDAKTIYQIAAHQSFTGGFGAFIVDTDYARERSFDVNIVFRSVKNPCDCYWDISAEHPNKIDGMYAGFITRMSRRKFKQVYGKEVEEDIYTESSLTQSKEEIALAVQPNTVEDPFNWADTQSITIVEDFRRSYVKDTLYKLSNGRELIQEEMDELFERSREYRKMLDEQEEQMGQMAGMEDQMGMTMEAEGLEAFDEGMEDEEEAEALELGERDSRELLWDDGEPVRIVDKKSIKRSKIMRYKIAGDYILEETEYPADDIGVIFVDQNSFYDKYGKQICRAFIQDAIDAQRYINYIATQSAYILKISRYDQFIGSKKNVASLDTQRNWKDPNLIQGLLAYDESPSGAKPEQIRPPELSPSLIQQYQRAMEDLYTSTGLYPTRLGQQGNEVSGAAIDARTRQGNYTTYCAFNAINRAITAGGTIVNQMIPRVYDSERVISLVMPDTGRKNITVNQQSDEYGIAIKNDIRRGEFEVVLEAGPSFEGQKAEALESLRDVLRASPETFNLIADLYAENLPLMNSLEIKNRLKTIVPLRLSRLERQVSRFSKASRSLTLKP